MEPIIRPAVTKDFENVKEFLREHYEFDIPEIKFDNIIDNVETSFKEHVGKYGTYVMELDNDIIGYLSVSVSENKKLKIKYGELHMIHVKKEYRGKGYSHKLMEEAEKYFKLMNVDAVKIETNIKNEVSQALYKKYGFEPWRISFKKWYNE